MKDETQKTKKRKIEDENIKVEKPKKAKKIKAEESVNNETPKEEKKKQTTKKSSSEIKEKKAKSIEDKKSKDESKPKRPKKTSKKIQETKLKIKEEKINEETKAEKLVEDVPLKVKEPVLDEKILETSSEEDTVIIKENIDSEEKTKNNTFQTSEVIVLVLLTCIVSLLMGILLAKSKNKTTKYDLSDLPQEVREIIDNYNYIKNTYGNELKEENLLNGALEGMLKSLGDPYAELLDPNSTSMIELAGEFDGIGVEIFNNEEGNIEVYSVFADSPAFKAGLKEGDILVSIDGENLLNIKTSTFTEKVKNSNEKHEIVYKRNGEEFSTSIQKGHIVIPSVFKEIYEEKGKKIGYLGISIFSATTGSQFKENLESLEKEKIDSLIIDVRGNSGGRLDIVSTMLSQLLDATHVIYQTDTQGKIEKFYSTGTKTKKYAIVVLTDKASASASEILASALKEEYGATVVGETTYGKGTVQQVKSLSNGLEYKLTTKKWLTPQGNWLDGKGLEPNIQVELSEEYYQNPSVKTDNQLKKAIEVLTK